MIQGNANQKRDYVVGFVMSKDGTRIGYRRYGAGPGVVLVQGAVGTTHSFHELAKSLARDFVVYVPERRGRPMSPRPYSPDHVVDREIEDLEALFEHSGANFLFGLSSGAVVALEAARVFPFIQKLVLYEAPLYVPPRQMRFDLVVRFHQEVAAGNIPAAMLTALIASGFAPPLLRCAPRRFVEFILMLLLRRNSRRSTSEYPPLRELVPSMRYDFSVVSSMQNRFETFRSVTSEVLLLSCRKSPAYLRESAATLRLMLPNSTHTEFRHLDHSGPWNADCGGQPATVAASMRLFFQNRSALLLS